MGFKCTLVPYIDLRSTCGFFQKIFSDAFVLRKDRKKWITAIEQKINLTFFLKFNYKYSSSVPLPGNGIPTSYRLLIGHRTLILL